MQYKKVTEEKEVIELLKTGWTIDQPILDEAMLIGNVRLEESRDIGVDLFYRLRSEGRIKRIHQMTQAHPLFRGRVDIYGLPDYDTTIDEVIQMNRTIKDIEVEYQGDIQTIGHMLNELENGRASYWFWHTLLSDTIALYRKAIVSQPYGILMHMPFVIDGKTCFDIEGSIAQGGYNKPWLTKMVAMYVFLTQPLMR